VDPFGSFKHTLKENIVLKRERIRITTTGEEAWRNPSPKRKLRIDRDVWVD